MSIVNPDPPPPTWNVGTSVSARIGRQITRVYPIELKHDDEVIMVAAYAPNATVAWDIVEAMTSGERL
jgi:hypothetical protein